MRSMALKPSNITTGNIKSVFILLESIRWRPQKIQRQPGYRFHRLRRYQIPLPCGMVLFLRNHRAYVRKSATENIAAFAEDKRMMDLHISADHVFIACGYTDMRKSIDGLSAIVTQQFHLNPFQPALFLFCGRRRDRFKALFWQGDGFLLLYKRIEKAGCNGRIRRMKCES